MQKKKIYKNAVAGYDFRYNADGLAPEQVRDLLKGIAKKYVFQKEQGDNGYLHYQGRLSLIKKRRKFEAIKLFVRAPNYFEPTCNPEFLRGEAFYQMKEDTRLEGPWKDTDEMPVLTRQIQEFLKWKLRPYQQRIFIDAQIFDMRKINLIWDTTGNCGKSLLSEYMEYKGLAEEVPPFRLMDDIFQWVATRPIRKCYIVDMPRGMKKDRLGDFYSGIEVIKNGVAYDKRHRATKIRFDRPRIFVFTNTLPNLELMSRDRWVIWRINKKYEVEEIHDETQ